MLRWGSSPHTSFLSRRLLKPLENLKGFGRCLFLVYAGRVRGIATTLKETEKHTQRDGKTHSKRRKNTLKETEKHTQRDGASKPSISSCQKTITALGYFSCFPWVLRGFWFCLFGARGTKLVYQSPPDNLVDCLCDRDSFLGV